MRLCSISHSSTTGGAFIGMQNNRFRTRPNTGEYNQTTASAYQGQLPSHDRLTSEAASGTFQSGQKWPRVTADPVVAYCTYQEDTPLQQGHMQSKDKCRQLVVKSAAAPGENKNEVRSSRRASHCSQRSREVCAAPQCTTIDLCLLVVLVHCLLRLLHHASCWSN
jgi:hypothetical protein